MVGTESSGVIGRLTQEFLTARERAEELPVEIVAIGQDYDGRVAHGRVQDCSPARCRFATETCSTSFPSQSSFFSMPVRWRTV